MGISRRQFVIGTALATAGAGFYGFLRRPARSRPNIVFILADDMRPDAIGPGKRPFLVHSPFDDIQAECLHVRNHFVTTSVCAVSRASILLGQYARRHNIWDFGTSFSEAQFHDSLPAMLRRAGYVTGFIGKWGVGDNFYRNRFDFYREGESRVNYATNLNLHLTDFETWSATRFLHAASRVPRPFFLQLSYKAPHRPFMPQPRFRELYREVKNLRAATDTPQDAGLLPASLKNSFGRNLYLQMQRPDYQETIRNYYRLCTGVEEGIGGIIKTLRELGLYDDTYIIVSSDNGLMLGEHGLQGKWCMYEDSIRVPLIIKPARGGALRPGSFDGMTLNIDIAPTILALAEVPIPPRMQGLPLTKAAGGAPWRTSFLYEDPLPRTQEGIVQCLGVRTEGWKYSRYFTSFRNEECLFDLTADAYQRRNLAHDPEHAPQLTSLRKQLADYVRTMT